MLSNHQINKITKQMYPSSAFPYKERIHLKQTAKEAIAEYLAENPNATYEDILQRYTDSEGWIPDQEQPTSHTTKIIVCMGLFLAIVCIICYLVANSWESPTYYF